MTTASEFFNCQIMGSETEHVVLDRLRVINRKYLLTRALRAVGPHYGIIPDSERLITMAGGILYGDTGDTCEYAGPEVTNGYDGAVHETAGSILWALLAAWADEERGQAGKAWILKTNMSHAGNPSGSNHVSVQLPLKSDDYRHDLALLVPYLKAFLVSLQVLVGAGVVLPPKKANFALSGTNYGYAISPRGYLVRRDIGAANGDHVDYGKPIFLDRNEALANDQQFWRMQVACMDSNILPSCIQLKMDLILLMCEMAINGALAPLVIRELSRGSCWSMRKISVNWRARVDIEVGPERQMTAREMQWFYYHQAEPYVEKCGSEYRKQLLRQWREMLEALDTDDDIPYGNYGKTDWVTKLVALRRRDEQHEGGLSLDQAEALAFWMHAYWLAKGTTCSPMKWVAKFGPPGMEQAIQHALKNPPTDTRAYGRGRAIALGPKTLRAGWCNVTPSPGNCIWTWDPTVPVTEELAQLLAQWECDQ